LPIKIILNRRVPTITVSGGELASRTENGVVGLSILSLN
jgi:hypothetical protein